MSDDEGRKLTPAESFQEMVKLFRKNGYEQQDAEQRACILGLASTIGGLTNAIEALASATSNSTDLSEIVTHARGSVSAAVHLILGIPQK